MATTNRTRCTRSRALWVLEQAGVVLLGIYIYFRVRGLTAGSREVAIAHSDSIVRLEERLGIHVESAMQAPVAASDTLVTTANWVYIWGHWPVIAVTMLWLAWMNTAVFLRLRDAMIISGAIGMFIYATYPLAPPRLAGLGLLDTVTQRSTAYRVLQPPAFVNPYAAMPSLHVGWDLLVGMAIVTASSTVVLRVLGYVMPVLMSLSVVVTANHYVLDAVVGIVLVLVAYACACALDRRRSHRANQERVDASADSEPIRG